MIAAAAYDTATGDIFQHFGRTETFRLYTIEDGRVTGKKDVSAAETGGHGALAPFLKDSGAEVLIAGGIGGGARQALAAAGIKLYPGVSGNADKAAEAFAAGTLAYDENAVCHHHDHEEGHSCSHTGGHGCGHHSC